MKRKTITFSVFIASNELAERLIILSNISSDLPIEGTGLTISLVVLSCPFVCPFKCIIRLDRTFVLYVHNKQPIGSENIWDFGILSIVSGEKNRFFDLFLIMGFAFNDPFWFPKF